MLNVMKIPPVGAEFHAHGWTDRQAETHTHDEANSRFSQCCAHVPINNKTIKHLYLQRHSNTRPLFPFNKDVRYITHTCVISLSHRNHINVTSNPDSVINAR